MQWKERGWGQREKGRAASGQYIYSRMQPNADFLIKHLEHILIRAAHQHLTMRPQAFHTFRTRARRVPKVHIFPLFRIKVPRVLSRTDDVFRLAHQEIYAGVQTRRDGLVERAFETLLFAHYAVEKIGSIYVC